MITPEELVAIDKNDLPERAKSLDAGDIRVLVDLLNEKGDVVRYHALLLLQQRSLERDDVSPYIDVFAAKLKSDNSYQRNIGALMTAANAGWDSGNRVDAAIDDYMALLDDEKPITVRQCLQALPNIIRHKPALRGAIAGRLLAFDLSKVRETMRKSILVDILGAMAELRKLKRSDAIEDYIQKALSGGMLDGKAVREMEALMQQSPCSNG